MADDSILGQKFQNKINKFPVEVIAIEPEFNFGGSHGIKRGITCQFVTHPQHQNTYPESVFDSEFEPYVPKPKSVRIVAPIKNPVAPAAAQPEPAPVGVVTKA